MNVAGGQHGLGTSPQVGFVQAALDAALAVSQFSPYDRVHSKSLLASGVEELFTLQYAETTEGF